MITTATPEQFEQIDKLREFAIDRQTYQYTDEEIAETVIDMYSQMDYKKPEIVIVDSVSQLKKHGTVYFSFWWQTWAYWYKGGEILGVKFDQDKLSLLYNWSTRCPAVVPFDVKCFVSRNPIEIHWQDRVLHNEEGMAVRFKDNTGLWFITGVKVDEQIVMQPHTQTMKQIKEEENEEVRRIRIERYGWESYLEQNNAFVIDERENEVEQNHEALFSCDNMKILVCSCPSTARVYALEVPEEINTCEHGQNWLRNTKKGFCLGAT